MKIVYLYDPETGEYKGTHDVVPDQLIEGGFIYPTHSTPEAPPEFSEFQIPVFRGGMWTVEEDHRGRTLFDKFTGDVRELTVIGKLPPNMVVEIPLEHKAKTNVDAQISLAIHQAGNMIDELEDQDKDATSWRRYRHALRQVKNQKEYPINVNWPKEP